MSKIPGGVAGMVGVVVPPGVGPRFPGLGDVIVHKLVGQHTNGQLLVSEYEAFPGAGPPLHIHTREDEVFWILEGELTFRVGERVHRAQPGTLLFGPRGIPHTFKNTSGRSAKMLVVATPADNFERFYAGVTARLHDGSPPGERDLIERIQELAPEHGIQIVGPNTL